MSAQAPATQTGEEIVARANVQVAPKQSEPSSVTSFAESDLERSSVRDIQDLQSLAPNVLIGPLPVSPGAASITIRGIGVSDTEKTYDPAVAVSIDGVFIGSMTTQLLNNFDLEEVVILRGPQGTQGGRHAAAGTIQVRRTRPTGKYGAHGSATLGSWGRHDYKLVLNAPVVEEVLALKLSGYSFNSAGAFYNTAKQEHTPEQRYLSGIIDLLFTPTARLEVLAKYERIRDRSETLPFKNASDSSHVLCFGPPLGITTFAEPDCGRPRANKAVVASAFRDDMDLDLDAATLEVTQRLSDGYKMVSIAGFRGHDEDIFQDFDGSAADLFSARRVQRYDQLSEELRLHAQPIQALELVTGVYYLYARYRLDQTIFFFYEQPFQMATMGALFPKGTVRVRDAAQRSHSLAGFAHARWELVENLRASAGARYTYEQKIFRNDLGLSNYLDPQAAQTLEAMDTEPALRARKDWKEPTWAAGLDYTLPKTLLGEGHHALVYTSYARGFKSGGFNGRADPVTDVTYDPETVDQYEVGLKTDWLKHRLTLNSALFLSDYRDKQEDIILPSQTGAQQALTRNAARVLLRGIELEAQALPLRGHHGLIGGLRLWGNLGLLQAEYRRFFADIDGVDAQGMVEKTDNRDFDLPNAPAFQFGVGVSNPYELSFGRVVLDVQYRRRGAVRTGLTFAPGTSEPDDRGVVPALGQCDASLTLEADDLGGGAFRITAFGRNVLNERAPLAYLDIPRLFAVRGDTVGRQWGIELAAKY